MPLRRMHADLIRIMFMESLKKDVEKPFMFRVAEAMYEAERELKAEPSDRDAWLVGEFFTGVLPLFGYICFAEP